MKPQYKDHLTPWKPGCDKTQMLDADSTLEEVEFWALAPKENHILRVDFVDSICDCFASGMEIG